MDIKPRIGAFLFAFARIPCSLLQGWMARWPRHSSKSEGELASAQFRFATLLPAAGSFIKRFIAKVDESAKSERIDLLSFRRKPESSHFNSFWTPAPAPDLDPGFAGVTGLGLFPNSSILWIKSYRIFEMSKGNFKKMKYGANLNDTNSVFYRLYDSVHYLLQQRTVKENA